MKKYTKKNQKTTTTFGAYIEDSVKIGENVKIYPNVYIMGNSVIGDNTVIYPNTIIENCTVGKDNVIKSSYLSDSTVGNNVQIGPFAHLRNGAEVGDNCRAGNFVEIKASKIGKETKVAHLAYVGDAIVGEDCNIGCGAIFVNYNGKSKTKINVGNHCFIGSNCNLIAPVNVADNTYLCAGSTLTKDTQVDDFVIARARETIKNNRAHEYWGE